MEPNDLAAPPGDAFAPEESATVPDLKTRFSQQERRAEERRAAHKGERTRPAKERESAARAAEWATRELDTGTALLSKKRRDQRANVKRAIDCFSRALTVFTPDHHRLEYARSQLRLGEAHLALCAIDREESHAVIAIDVCTSALAVLRPGTEPFDWADVHSQLGRGWLAVANGPRFTPNAVPTAIQHLSAALMVYATEDESVEKADVFASLGAAWRRAAPSPGVNIDIAQRCLEEALTVYSCDEHPARWARAQCELGQAWRELQTGDRTFNTRQAIGCFREAVAFGDRNDDMNLWRTAQFDMGRALLDLDSQPAGRRIAVEDRADTLDEAFEALDAALECTSRESQPLEWATQTRLIGVCLTRLASVRAEGARAAQAQALAVTYLGDALEIYTADRYPIEHAEVQGELGVAHMRSFATVRDPDVRRAIECFKAARAPFTREDDPERWGLATWRLGQAMREVSSLDVLENYTAANYLEAALEALENVNESTDGELLEEVRAELQKRAACPTPEPA